MEQIPTTEKGPSFMAKSKAWAKNKWEESPVWVRGITRGAGIISLGVVSPLVLEKYGIDINQGTIEGLRYAAISTNLLFISKGLAKALSSMTDISPELDELKKELVGIV